MNGPPDSASVRRRQHFGLEGGSTRLLGKVVGGSCDSTASVQHGTKLGAGLIPRAVRKLRQIPAGAQSDRFPEVAP